jgi:hypothetical protein
MKECFEHELAALVRSHGVDIHNDPDVYAAMSMLRQLVATHTQRMIERRAQFRSEGGTETTDG